MPDTDPDALRSPLERAARPLLRLAQRLTGLESTFITSIDWDDQTQTVLYSANEGALQMQEGVTVDWQQSLCRATFLSGREHTSEVDTDAATPAGARALGIRSFVAVPILVGDKAIGTVCGASERRIELDPMQLEGMQLIADALQQLLHARIELARAHERVGLAEQEAAEARSEALRHAADKAHMEHLAHTDVLTGLANRRAFMSRWEDELARSGRRNYPIGLMLLDADRFKAVNDTWGHPKGDAVLRAIGATLMAVARSADVVARLGGDEFAMVTTHGDEAHLQALAADIQRRFAVLTAELGVDTTLSIGIVSSHDCPRDRMLAAADEALYVSKGRGGNAMHTHRCGQDSAL